MKNFYGLVATVAFALLGSAHAMAFETQVFPVQNELIKSVKVELVSDKTVQKSMMSPLGWESDCTKLSRNQATTKNDPDLDDIINIGKQIWEIVKNNGPVLEAKTMSAHALPRGIQCWDELHSWSAPRAQTYQVTYTNLYGMDVIKFKFRLLYTWGGSYKGVGKYLTNATIQYSNVEVAWGYIFNASVEIPQVINMGPEGSPLAGMQLSILWNVSTRPITLKKSISSTTFFVAGDGRKTEILD